MVSVTGTDAVMYADDTTLVCGEWDGESCRERVKHSLDELSRWFALNNLLLNVSKTQVIQFRSDTDSVINYNDIEIRPSQTASFLGVTLDQQVNWKQHIEKLSVNISRYSYALRVIRDNVWSGAALSAYHAYIQSRVRYGLIFWGNSVDSSRIFILQKRCIRIIFGLGFRDSCRELFRTCGILTLYTLYIYDCISFILNNYSLFEELGGQHRYSTRFRDNLRTDRPNYTFVQRNVKFNILKVWNKLPVSFRDQPSKGILTKLRRFLIEKSYYTLNDFYEDREMNGALNI